MSNLGKKVLLYRTDISGKTPSVSGIAIGELALNYNAETPFVAFKDTNNEIQKIGALTNSIGDSEFVTMSQKSITENLVYNINNPTIHLIKNYLDDGSYTYNITQEDYNLLSKNLNCDSFKLINIIVDYDGLRDIFTAKAIYYGQDGGCDTTEIEIFGNNILGLGSKIINATIGGSIYSDLTTSIEIEKLTFSIYEGGLSVFNYSYGYEDELKYRMPSSYESVTYNKTDLFTPASASQTLDEAIKTVDTNISTLVNEVLKDEEVIAAALTKHNESAGFNENANYIVNENATYISAATSLAEADNLLDAAINNVYDELQQQIPSLDGYATETWVNNKGYATLTEVESKVSELVDSAPDTLNTLNELAAALNNDANFATTVTNQIATKANSSDVYTKTESDSKYSLTSHTHDVYALKTALDTANNTIATLQTTISNLETKIANIIAAVGLNTDGTFIVPTSADTSGYTTAANSVMNAVILMDNQIEENETVSAYALTDLNHRLTIVETEINNLSSTE